MPTLDDILQAARTLAEYYDARATGARHALDASYYRNTAKTLRRLVGEHESAARDIGKLTAINGDLAGENTRLRAALAQSDQPCAYCSLPRDEWAKCKNGFPGCDRSDDAMGCPHLGASLEADRHRAALQKIRDEIAADKDTTIVKMVGRIFHTANNALEGES